MPDFSLEQRFDGPVCGIDEVGRGPLAGPVVAACVYIPENARALPFFASVNDSKAVPKSRRAELADLIQTHTIWGIGQASVEEIDQINILQATFLAMRRAYDAMSQSQELCNPSEGWDPKTTKLDPSLRWGCRALLAHLALIDGNRTPKGFPVPVQTVIKGDTISMSIAAASIIAKVARDQLMADLHAAFPHYGWANNAGYGTAAHLAALAEHGPCLHHRHSFAPIRDRVFA